MVAEVDEPGLVAFARDLARTPSVSGAGRDLARTPSVSGAGRDVELAAERFRALGVENAGFGVGLEQTAHQTDEYVSLHSLRRGARGFAALTAQLAADG